MRLKILSCVGLLCAAFSVNGQSLLNTNRTARSLSLDECIKLALEHNLRIQISRLDPNISRFTLAASYGIYDPYFSARYDKRSGTAEGRFDPATGVNSPASTSDEDSVTPGVSGYLPTGLRYNFGGEFAHSRGSRGALDSDFDNYISSASMDLSQPLLKNFWTDAGRTDIKINKLELKTSELALDAEVRLVVRDVLMAYYELSFAREDVKVQEKAYEVASVRAGQERQKVAVGTLAPLDAKLAEAEAAINYSDLLNAQRRLLVAEDVLKNLITDDYASMLDIAINPADKLVAVPEAINLTESWTAAVTKRPDYKQLQLEAEKQGLVVKLRYNQLYPELNLVGGYGLDGLDSTTPATTTFFTNRPALFTPAHQANFGDSLEDIGQRRNPQWNFGAVLTIPFSNKRERNLYKAAKEVKNRIGLELTKLHQDILTEVHAAVTLVKFSYENVSATRQTRLYREEAVEAEEKKLLTGKSTAYNVLQVQRDLTQARSDEIRALADYNRHVTTLFYSEGTLLERKQISVKYK